MKIRKILNAIAAMAAASCVTKSGVQFSPDQKRAFFGAEEILIGLDVAERKWSESGIQNYSFNICRGGVFGCSTYWVHINGEACGMRLEKKIGIGSAISCKEAMMPSLFTEIRNEAGQDNYRIEATFDEEIGYLTSFSVEPRTDLTDQGWRIQISKFRVGR